MTKLAYIPQKNPPNLKGHAVHSRNSRYWKGEIEPCSVVMVHPRCPNVAAIERAYAVAGKKVEPWNLPDYTKDPPPIQKVLKDGAWKGEDVIIIGGGPSLKAFDWYRLDDCGLKTIAINRAYETVPNPTLVYGMDNRFFTWANGGAFGADSLRKWNAITCPIICSTLRPTNGGPRCVHVLRTTDKKSDSLETGLYCGGNSGMGALHLCSLLGVRRAYLLGYDCVPGPANKTVNFHNGYMDKQDADVYPKFVKTFNENAAKLLEKMQVINCNPDSAVKCFPFGDLPDGPLNPSPEEMPMIVSYITPNYKTYYEKHLRPGLEKYGMKHVLYERESEVDWRRNACAKAHVIKAAYKEYGKGRGLIWLDADASVERFPALFAALPKMGVDFAAHWLKSGEMLSSTLYFGDSLIAEQIINEWCDRCTKEPAKYATGDQAHLQEVTQNTVCNVERLPGQYAKIFDHKAYVNMMKPVIVQHQASRENRKVMKRRGRKPKHDNT